MQQHSCFVLNAMVNSLIPRLQNAVLEDIYSNSKDELLLNFSGFYMKCLFHGGEIFFRFEPETSSKSRLYKPQFTTLQGKKILQIKAHKYERSFQIDLEGNTCLIFKCHGRKSNILSFENGEFSDMFIRQLEQDSSAKTKDFFSKPEPDPAILGSKDFKQIQSHYPYLPSEFIADLKQNADPILLLEKYNQFSSLDISDTFELHISERHNTILEDLNTFAGLYLRARRFESTHTDLLKKLQKSVKEKEVFILRNQEALHILENKRSDEELGNILLAYVQQIPANSRSAIVQDIYRNNTIEIKLDEKLNAVQNAEAYFRKAKGLPHNLSLLRSKIQSAESSLKKLKENLSLIETAKEWKDLKPLTDKKSQIEKEEILPFRKFTEMDFEIYVGKSADSNEKILNYYSDKDDIWLHAKDVSGSHVLIRSRKGSTIPETVLERAASLAAYYSKNRNQSLVTVTYTLRKYVRKIKGADKGKVTVTNEKSILVKPSK